MKGFKTKLDKLGKAITPPEKITLTALYSDGHEVSGLPLDAELQEDAEHVRIFNGELLVIDWLPADCWMSL